MNGGLELSFELSLDQVSRTFGSRRALKPLTASVSTGQVMVVTGPNGSGKSTLLKIVARLMRPTSGRVTWRSDGKELGIEASRTLLGMVSPDLTLYDELTAIENLAFFSRVRGVAGTRASSERILAELGLAGRGDDLVGAFSSGMKQRLKFAFALMHRPRLLLLDEPTSNLDEQGVLMVRGLIEAARNDTCIVIATNEPEEVLWGDFVIKLGT
ncbi:MAG: putative ABC transporter ATP-binding protein YxlF [Firmicutes bacterium ADurb.Bin506]|nr:MAG: putative ABC transporter ATP-binding protein YxlF [Firmicutes bacterium ADurb.Bin506]